MGALEIFAVVWLESGVVVREEEIALLVGCATVKDGELEYTLVEGVWLLLLLAIVVGSATDEEAGLEWDSTAELRLLLLLDAVVG